MIVFNAYCEFDVETIDKYYQIAKMVQDANPDRRVVFMWKGPPPEVETIPEEILAQAFKGIPSSITEDAA